MKNLYFFSDAHLALSDEPDERLREDELLRFLERITPTAEKVFILGDLLDFWFEWRHVVPRYYFQLFHRFKTMIEQGVELHYLAGNHDFNLTRYLSEEVGLLCHDGDFELACQGKKFWLSHGDGLAKKDGGYRLLKRVIRHPAAKFLFRNFVPSDFGVSLARWTSHSSRALRKIDRPVWADEYFDIARSKFQAGFDYVLLGHLHYPDRREVGDKVYLNLGDWFTHFTYACFDGHDLSLETWSQTKVLIPSQPEKKREQ